MDATVRSVLNCMCLGCFRANLMSNRISVDVVISCLRGVEGYSASCDCLSPNCPCLAVIAGQSCSPDLCSWLLRTNYSPDTVY
jgi:hypothetical protein